MADKLDLSDMDWIYDWCLVPVLALCIYLICAGVRDRGKDRQNSLGAEEAGEL
jgi:hypothetical protein